MIFFNVYCIFFGFRAFYPQIIQNFVLPLHRNQMRHESSEMASLTKVSSRVRDCSAPHLLLSPFEHSSLGAPTETHRTFIALPSHTRTRIAAMRRSSSLRLFQMRFARSRWLQKKIILVILYNFVLLNNKIPKIKQDYLFNEINFVKF